MGSAKHPITIGILSLVFDKAIDTQLIPMLKSPSTKFRFVQLKPADLNVFTPPGDLHAVILLHPFTEGRLSLTNVTDARYSKLLPILSSHFGSHGVCVIAYLIRNFKESTELTHLNTVKNNQPTVFEMASCVILCGKLEDLFQRNIQKIHEFMKVNWENIRQSAWQDEWTPKTPTEEEIADKQIQDPKSEEEEIIRETRSSKNEVVLVTDASGFIGSHIVKKLIQNGYKVRGVLDLEKGTLDSIEKRTLDDVEIQAKVGMLKGLFPEIELFEAGIRYPYGWSEAVQGCTRVIHTSRVQDNGANTGDNVTKLLHACQDDGGVKRIVLTGGSDLISAEKLRNKERKGVNSALTNAICKDVSEKAASRFMMDQREEKPMFGLSIIKPPVVLGPILCELAEANVEIVRRRMVDASSGWSEISIPVCDVRDVAEAHVMALNFKDTGEKHERYGVVQQRLSLKKMAGILEREFKDQGYDFPSRWKPWTMSRQWDDTVQCLSNLYGNTTGSYEEMAVHTLGKHPIDNKKSVIDMAYSCIERGFITQMPSYRPRGQGKRGREKTTSVSPVYGSDNADVYQYNSEGSQI